MNDRVREKMMSWLGGFPETSHPLDIRRMYDFVREACIRESHIYDDDLAMALKIVNPDWNDKRIEDFVNKKMSLIEHLQDFYFYCFDTLDEDEDKQMLSVDSVDDFIESGDFNYYELYELSQAVGGYSESLNAFTLKDAGDIRRIEYPIMDIAFSFPKSQSEQILKHIETYYMDNLDPETWYGFKYAMERAEEDD